MTATLEPLASETRTPPQDANAEQIVLGAMMLSPDAIADVSDTLTANDFYRPAHTTIYNAITHLYGSSQPVDFTSVNARLIDTGDILRVGGSTYLHDCVHTVPTAANAGYYAGIVRDRAVRRRIIEAATRSIQLAYGGDGSDATTILDRAQQAMFDVAPQRTSDGLAHARDIIQSAFDFIEAAKNRDGATIGVPTGFKDLDRLLNNLQAGQVVVAAGRPGLGKSTFAADVVRHNAIRLGNACAIFTLEMSKQEMMLRLLSAEAAVPIHSMRSGFLGDHDWAKLAKHSGPISDAPLHIDDTPGLTLMDLRAKCRRLKQRHDLKLIVVDYLQLMTMHKRVESRQQEVAEISRGLKLLAKENDCPLIAVSQLNRGPEQRTDKRPMLSDLRESGSVEQDADIVIFVHRDEKYDKESPRSGEADFIVAKNRFGPEDTVTVSAQLHVSRFVDMAI